MPHRWLVLVLACVPLTLRARRSDEGPVQQPMRGREWSGANWARHLGIHRHPSLREQ
jgi:hypothetical protein